MVPGNWFECCLSLDLEIGTNRLLSIEALGWVPMYASINGQICSQDHSLWWKEGDELCLFRAPWMSQGDILHIEISFTLIRRIDDLSTEEKQFIMVNGTLPHITDKVILGGNLTCNINDAVVKISRNKDSHLDDSVIVTFSAHAGENTRRLPLLRRGYKLEFGIHLLNPKWRFRSKPLAKADKIRFSKGFPLQPRSLRFEDESEDTSSSSSKYPFDGLSATSSPCMQSIIRESIQDEKAPDTDDEDNLETRTSNVTDDDASDREDSSFSHHSGSESQVDLPSMKDERWRDAMLAALNTNDDDLDIEKDGDEDHADNDPAGTDLQGDTSNATEAKEEKKDEEDGDDPHPVDDDMPPDADGNTAGVLAPFQTILNDDTDSEDDDDDDDDEIWDDEDFDDLFPIWNHLVDGVSMMILWFLHGIGILVRWLEGRSWAKHLLRFLILEVVCLGLHVGSRDRGGSGIGVVEEVGGVDGSVQVIPGLERDWEGGVVVDDDDDGVGAMEKGGRSLRDRIDLAMGWRPVGGVEIRGGRE
ncbi:MAG: hypothetical protein Q9182_003608 [Xanthomendoza sp. 2 TL-2023]